MAGGYAVRVSFLDDLRDFLRQPMAAPMRNLPEYRRHFIAELERKEREGAPADWLALQQSVFGSRLENFVHFLEKELMAEGMTPEELPAQIKNAISHLLGVEDFASSTTRKLIVRRVVDEFADSLGWLGPRPARWANVASYAHENRLIQWKQDEVTVTPLGRILLDVTGIDAITWLLHIEVALSTGLADEWRLDRETLKHLVQAPNFVLHSDAWAMHGFTLNWSALRRLEAFGIIGIPEDHDLEGYTVSKHALPMLAELANNPDSPMSVLVDALLQDDVQSRLPGISAPSSAAAIARHARLVVHEVRNALIPVRVALDSIYREAQKSGLDQAIAPYKQRVDQGLERMLSFASDQKTMSERADLAQDIFDVGTAIREAIAVIQGENGRTPELSLPESLPRLHGVRERFVLALLNLLRNAYQAAPADSPRISVQVVLTNGHLQLVIEDNGPGVAPAERERIFLDGYSTRAGGSGHGLALARAVFQDEMGGKLTYEDGSSLGGARFVVTLKPHDRSAT